LTDFGKIRNVYAGNRSIEVVNIWCDSVGKLKIYRQKNLMGHFPPKFSESPSSKTTEPIEKSRGCKNGTDLIYLQAKFSGDPPLHGHVRKKSWKFFSFLLSPSGS